ncbi:MAG TPA: transporter substrate-binding domain-containing protein [Candidatus Limnocylindria bacterium]|nr:transporter substrate-binding domain-containing protein [Candidatus Limnocylindria bacterium]
MTIRARAALLLAPLLVLTACAAPAASPTMAPATQAPATQAPMTEAPMTEAPMTEAPMTETPATSTPAAEPDGHLARILEADTIIAFTDPAYPPQSFLNEETGDYEGFDIDVTLEIAERLGVSNVEFTTPSFDLVVAGNWADRFDMAVGSVTITEPRREVLDFTQPYYFTPAQLATHPDAGITDIAGFAGETICVGEATTYLDWLEGTLQLPAEAGEVADPPEGVVSTTLPTDLDCATAWQSGRFEFNGWLTAQPTAQAAIDEAFPVVLVGDPVFFEPLAVVFDGSVEDNDSLVAEVDRILGEMHADGTLTELSEKWYDGLDLTSQ